MGDAARPWLAEMLAAPGPPPPWITAGVPIARDTLNFEANGWQTFVCSRIDLSQNENNLPPRAVLVASIIAVYPINVGAIMSANISVVVRKGESSYPYPNTLTEYITDSKVEPRSFDTKVRAKKPFLWYSLQGPGNPKFKGKATATIGQSDEPSVVVTHSAAEPSTTLMPSTSAGPSTETAGMPPPSSSRPSAPVPASSIYPLTALRVSQTLASLNNYIQTTTSKLSDISSVVAAESSTPAAPQVPPSVEKTLKKILDNQKTIMDTLVAHGGAIEELGK
ncbi:adhesin AWP1-like [Nicotiana tomentosiformis]|uniref:adhesin AWP1-like n=1 Tax=Nicotiana tomentosiformis TaxID=4098 RepID=UPI00388C4E1B